MEEMSDRHDLGFVEEAVSACSFLEASYGFRLASTTRPTFVRYESGTVFVNIYHGRQSYELNVEIGLLIDPFCRSYGLADVLKVVADIDDQRQTYFQASSRQRVREQIHVIAKLVAGHHGALLKGDIEMFGRVEAQTSEDSAVLTKQIQYGPIREAAQKAWKAKDFGNAYVLYSTILDDLSPSERKRLEYAERHRLD